MLQGLQVWDRYGNSTLDVSDSLTRVLGTIQTQGRDDESGAYSDERLLGGRPWFTVLLQQVERFSPKVTISGSTISWAAEQYYPMSPSTIIYGIY